MVARPHIASLLKAKQEDSGLTVIPWGTLTFPKPGSKTEVINEGSFGIVLAARYRGAKVAVKQLKAEADIEAMLDEAVLLRPVASQFVVRVLGVASDLDDKVAMLMERLGHSQEAKKQCAVCDLLVVNREHDKMYVAEAVTM